MNARTNEGKTVFDLAQLAGQEPMLRFLKKYARRKGKRIPRARKPVAAAIAQVKSVPKPAKSKNGLENLGIDMEAASALLGL